MERLAQDASLACEPGHHFDNIQLAHSEWIQTSLPRIHLGEVKCMPTITKRTPPPPIPGTEPEPKPEPEPGPGSDPDVVPPVSPEPDPGFPPDLVPPEPEPAPV